MIKKAVIMVAGKGVRMLPLTKLVPKPLIKVNGKPFLSFILNNLRQAGIEEFGFVVGYKHTQLQHFVEALGINAKFIMQAKRLGTGHALKQAKIFAGNDNFIALGGDSLWAVRDILEVAKDDDFSYVTTTTVEDWSRYGIIVDHDGFLQKIVEKPKIFVGNQINTGLYKFTPEIFSALEKIKKSPRGEYELTDAISMLAAQNKVKVQKIKDYWLDLGKLPDIQMIENFLKEHNIN